MIWDLPNGKTVEAPPNASKSDLVRIAIEQGKASPDEAWAKPYAQQAEPQPAPPSAPQASGVQPTKNPNYFAGPLRAVGQGLTLGWGDEIESAVTGTPVEQIRADMDQFKNTYGASAAIGEGSGAVLQAAVGGGIVNKLAGPVVNAAARTIPGWGVAGAGGVAEGAAYGAGAAEEGDRLSGAATGAVAGGLTAVGLYGSIALMSRLYHGVLLPLAQAVTGTPDRTAKRIIREALQKTGMTVDEARAALKELGGPARLAHLDDHLMDLAYNVSSGTGPGRTIINNMVDDTQAGQQLRILAAASEDLGDASAARQFMETIRNAKSELAAPLYARAHQANIRTVPQFEKLMEGVPPAAVRRAREIARSEYYAGLDIPGLDHGVPGASAHVGPKSGGAVVRTGQSAGQAGASSSVDAPESVRGVTGEVVDEIQDGFDFDALPDVLRIDYIKRGWDDIISNLYKNGAKQQASAYVRLKNKILDFVDSQVPEYKQARGIWAGASQIEEAQNVGRDIFTTPYEDIAENIRRMGESEKRAFKLGVAEAVKDKVESAAETHDAVKRLLASTKNRERIRAAFDNDEAFNKFMKQLRAEAVFSKLRRVVQGGSDTHARLKRDMEINDIPTTPGELVKKVADPLREKPLQNPETNRLVSRALVGNRVPPYGAESVPQTQQQKILEAIMMGQPILPFMLQEF